VQTGRETLADLTSGGATQLNGGSIASFKAQIDYFRTRYTVIADPNQADAVLGQALRAGLSAPRPEPTRFGIFRM
jgi:hypothetical protein